MHKRVVHNINIILIYIILIKIVNRNFVVNVQSAS